MPVLRCALAAQLPAWWANAYHPVMAVQHRSTKQIAPLSTDATAALRVLAEALLDDLPALCDRLVEVVYAQIPPYTSGRPVGKTELRRSAEANLSGILHKLAELHTAATKDPFDAPRYTGHLRAEQGMPLDFVLQAFRIGGRVVWEALVNKARSTPNMEPELLLDGATVVWEAVDEFSSALANSYHRTESGIQRRDARRREATLEALLDGRADTPSFLARAAATLDVAPTERLLMVSVSTDSHDDDPVPGWMSALRSRGLPSVWISRLAHHVALILLGATPIDRAVTALRELPEVSIGVSPPFTGLAGVADAHRFAETALHTVPSDEHDVACLDDRLIEALVTGNPEIAHRLVRLYLGGLLALAPEERQVLLSTLRVWLEAGGSIGRSAQKLFCHRNTVLNRIHQIEQLTDRQLSSGADRIGCAVALRALPFVNS
ncbi:MAG: PucR family transcriptional regulator [Pseudonocardiaceae bacterium]|nr:PucR family transcriptional regulator [Pseudonocardiaceae bacterium]